MLSNRSHLLVRSISNVRFAHIASWLRLRDNTELLWPYEEDVGHGSEVAVSNNNHYRVACVQCQDYHDSHQHARAQVLEEWEMLSQ